MRRFGSSFENWPKNKILTRQNELHPTSTFDTKEMTSVKETWHGFPSKSWGLMVYYGIFVSTWQKTPILGSGWAVCTDFWVCSEHTWIWVDYMMSYWVQVTNIQVFYIVLYHFFASDTDNIKPLLQNRCLYEHGCIYV